MNDNAIKTAALQGFYFINKAYRWLFTKPQLLILSIALIALQILEFACFMFILHPQNILNILNLTVKPENIGMLQSIAIASFALITFCHIALILVITEVTISLLHNHKPYMRHALITSFSKILKIGFLIPAFMLAIFGLYYLFQLPMDPYFIITSCYIIINLIVIIYMTQSIFIIVHENKFPIQGIFLGIKQFLKQSPYHIGAILYYLLWYLAINTYTKFLLTLQDHPYAFILSIISIPFSIIYSLLSMFIVPGYTIYTALVHDREKEAIHLSNNETHND